jgi:hypothetical protein
MSNKTKEEFVTAAKDVLESIRRAERYDQGIPDYIEAFRKHDPELAKHVQTWIEVRTTIRKHIEEKMEQ